MNDKNTLQPQQGPGTASQTPPSSVGLNVQVDYGSNPLRITALDAFNALMIIELLRSKRKDGSFALIPLGIGRTAKVFLGAVIPRTVEAPNEEQAQTQFIAIKCLLTDPDIEYRDQMRHRFDEEVKKTRNRAGSGPTFVHFVAYGWLDLDKRVSRAQERNKGRLSLHDAAAMTLKTESDSLREEEIKRLKLSPWSDDVISHLCSVGAGEALDGPFYAMELCQGSLLDVLEGISEWRQLPYYQALNKDRKDLDLQQRNHADDAKLFADTFFVKDWKAETYSGYEILNAFKPSPESERLRGRIVLELAKAIAQLISDLHRDTRSSNPGKEDDAEGGLILPEKTSGGSKSLAHRDLKPGNILLLHEPGESGLRNDMHFRLSDLGYLVGLDDLRKGDSSLSLDHWRAYQVPGSPYYRAPEQMRQSIEVRLRIKKGNGGIGTWFEVLSSKADYIEPGDYLALPTVHFAGGTGRLLVIQQVEQPDHGSQSRNATTSPRSQRLLRVADEALVAVERDIVGHVVKATGFHTDGYSFGALLYDLISGGKNPEEFFQYCLQYYQYARPADMKRATDVVKAIRGQLKGSLEKIVSDEHKYARYLRDTRNVEIPEDILVIICRCMLRDFEDSFYNQARQTAGQGDDDSSVGWITERNVRAFEEIHKAIEDLWNNRYNQPTGVPPFLATNTLLRLRCIGRAPHGK